MVTRALTLIGSLRVFGAALLLVVHGGAAHDPDGLIMVPDFGGGASPRI
jgi:hypothetical protein